MKNFLCVWGSCRHVIQSKADSFSVIDLDGLEWICREQDMNAGPDVASAMDAMWKSSRQGGGLRTVECEDRFGIPKALREISKKERDQNTHSAIVQDCLDGFNSFAGLSLENVYLQSLSVPVEFTEKLGIEAKEKRIVLDFRGKNGKVSSIFIGVAEDDSGTVRVIEVGKYC